MELTSGKRSFHGDDDSKQKMRADLFLLFLFLALGIIGVRLVHLQIIKGAYYRMLSDSNRIQTQPIHAPRGIIFDRNGIPLVFNIPGFRQVISGKTRLISKDKALPMLARRELGLEVDALRQYPYKEAFAHVLGYIGQISKKELQNSLYQDYHGGDIVGKMGIEEKYEKQLVGIDGKKLVEVDNTGRQVRTLGQTDPIPGQNLTVTLDVKLQEVAYNALSKTRKAAVIVSSKTGEILALVSKPSFDPNLFTLDETYTASPSSYQTVSEVLSDSENQPFVNRAIAGVYPPGSTFKLITAAAGLEEGVIDEKYLIEDTGEFFVGPFSFSNWYYTQYGKTEGAMTVVSAIKRSNDIFFNKLAGLVGVEKLSVWAKKFGLGQKLGIDLEGEAEGFVPTPSWKKKAIGESWYLGDTYHYGIGQGYLLATPLQVNMWTSVIANGGVLYKPRLLKNSKFEIRNSKFLSEKTVSLIREGMVQSCSPGGVAWPLFKLKIKNEKLKIDGKNFLETPQSTISANFKDYREVSIACKTGTAEHGGKADLPHAWITLFAPAYNPQIVVTVLVESSGEGSNIAAPIAKKILEEWFSR